MVIKTGPNKGELTAQEIRKLIRAHNIVVKIKLPPKLDRDGLIAFLKANKFEVDHENERLIDKSPNRGKSLSLGTAKVLTKPKPKTKTQKEKKDLKEKLKSEKPTPTFNPKDVKVVGVKGEKESSDETEVLQLEDKTKETWKFNKALRTRLNREFKKKFGKTANKILDLGLDPSPKEVKEACRKLKLKNHPDKGGDPDTFISIQEACDLLISTFKG